MALSYLSQQERPKQEPIIAIKESSIKNVKRKALIIGISQYDHSNKFPNLEFCENDANEVCSILKDQGYEIRSALVERVEWAKMREEVIRFFTDRTVKPDDTLFFYFSGHGYLDKNTGRTYLSTSEIDPAWPALKAIPFEELTSYINDSISERIVAVLDCCYSGALEIGGKGGGEEEDDKETAKAERGEEMASLANTNVDRTVKRLIRSGHGKCVLASSLEEQRSFKMEGQPYSTFTYFLVQGLKGAKGESVDDNGYVTPELLGKYINKKILELDTVKQKPVRKTDITGEIILAHYPYLAKGQQSQRDYLLQLLRDGNIDEFNEIRRRDNYSKLDLYNVDLSKKDLKSINFEAVDLSRANLMEADLSNANLQKVILFGAHGYRTNFEGAELSDADLSNCRFVMANLSHVNLSGAKLSNATLASANLSGADLSFGKLAGSKLPYANLSGADVSNADLSGGALQNADLSHANLSHSDLSGAYLKDANLSGADLSFGRLLRANLSQANLSGANLRGANFSSGDLSKANFEGAYLGFVTFSYADLSNANLVSSILIVRDLERYAYPAVCENANFENAIIYNENLSKHLSARNGKNVASGINDKKELGEELEKRGFSKERIEEILYLL